MFEACPLSLGHRQAFVQVSARLADRALHRRDESGFAQRVRQVGLKLSGHCQGLPRGPTGVREQLATAMWD